VRAAGLNFRDVTVALGLVALRDSADAIGSECAGIVLEVGPGVDLVPGERVMGLVAGGFGPVAVSDRRLLARVPDDWSFAQAASVPIVFLTAYHGLVDLAGVKPGERLLVHAAAGGVGMAAVQLARHLASRCSPPPARGSGRRCGPWGWIARTSPPRARWSSGSAS